MEELIEILAFFSWITAVFLVFALITLRVYLSIRRCFPIPVNCWFCNKWSWVPYDSRNCFDCVNCSQYNGFTEDGGYNKIIEDQHRSIKTPITNSPKKSNGLCTSCNINQQLKISQLAMFTPLVEENYNEEIEHFRIQLEKAYELCPPCSRFLKNTLLRETASFFGNHMINIQRKGINIYEKLMKKSNANKTSSHFLKVLKRIQGILAILIIFEISCRILPEWFPEYLLPYLEFYNYISKTLQTVCTQLISASCFPLAAVEYINLKVFCFIGFFMQILLFPMEQTLACIKINQILCWSFLALVSWTNSQGTLISSFQIICACPIFYNSFYKFKTNPRIKITKKKLPRSCDNSYYCDDISDNEDFTSSYKDNVINKKITEKFTANHISNRKTENNCNVGSFTRSHREDPHPSKSLFKLNKTDPLPFSRSSPNKKQGQPPAKLNYLDTNMWVAGGFWKCANGTIVPMNQGAKKSGSPSSGFFSQAKNDSTTTFSNGRHYSLSASVETSLSGEFEKLSITPKSPYASPSGSPPVRTPNLSYPMPPFGSPPVRTPNSSYIMPPFASTPVRSPYSSYAMSPSGIPQVRSPYSSYAMSPSGIPQVRSPYSSYAMSPSGIPQVRSPNSRYSMSASGIPQVRLPNSRYAMSSSGFPQMRSPNSRYAMSPSGLFPQMRSPNSRYAMAHSGLPQVRSLNSSHAMSLSGFSQVRTPNSSYAMSNMSRTFQPLPSWTSNIHYMGYNRPMGNFN